MAKKKKSSTLKNSKGELVRFRERKFSDILDRRINHPMPIPGYKSTLIGPPGWDSKENPLGLKISSNAGKSSRNDSAKTRKRRS